jgi:segregation and condensation protein A
MANDIYAVKLEVFEGPMDLLVFLIRKNEVDIYDIPISIITEQYLSYIGLMKMMNINLAADFIHLAATLTQIKSRMLLPFHGTEEEEEEDPRLAITRPLIEYLQMKEAAESLMKREILHQDIFIRTPGKEEETAPPENDDMTIEIGIVELIRAFNTVLLNMKKEHTVALESDKITVKERIMELIALLEEKSSLVFDELFAGENRLKRDIVVTFLAILEMAKMSLIRIIQHIQGGVIRLFYV